jgi:hypothetical protein
MDAALLAKPDLWGPSSAVISTCETYRYWLHRRWLSGHGWTVFAMLNPSKADAYLNDPTVTRTINFAQTWGSNGVIVVNMFGARSTDPKKLLEIDDPVGPENHAHVMLAAELSREGGRFICAWGANPFAALHAPTFLGWLDAAGVRPLCLGTTASGAPTHPLYIKGDTQPVPYASKKD